MKRKLNNIVGINCQENDLDFRFKGVEALQLQDLSQPLTVGLVSHGDPNSGVIDIKGITKLKTAQIEALTVSGDEVQVGKSSTHVVNDNLTLSLNTQRSNINNYVLCKIHISLSGKDSFIDVRLFKDGSSYVVEQGYTTGDYLSQFSFTYNSVLSGQNGTHYIDVVGAGTGAQATIKSTTYTNF